MNVYLLKQFINTGYDTYDACVVAAESEEEARYISPNDVIYYDKEEYAWFYDSSFIDGRLKRESFGEWVDADQIDKIEVTFLGIAKEGTKKGLILGSFNAG
jgi:hypothetical protein